MVSNEQAAEEAAHDRAELAAAEAAWAEAERAEREREGPLPVSPGPAWADMHDLHPPGAPYDGSYHIEGRRP